MSHGHPSLPILTVNRSFMAEFIAADTPCFALGMVEVQQRQCGLLALRTHEEIPPDISDGGFNFGHSLFGHRAFEVIHFAFERIGKSNALLHAACSRTLPAAGGYGPRSRHAARRRAALLGKALGIAPNALKYP